MKTLLLDTVAWDLVLDAGGNIAVASNPYALAQDVASAIRLFQGELWYDTTKGIPYWTQILGRTPPLALVRSKFEAAAMTVPEVTSVQCFLTINNTRRLGGQVQVRSGDGSIQGVGF